MGKTPKPLNIALTDASIAGHPEWERLRAQGHNIWLLGDTLPSGVMPDLVIGPRAWYANTEHLDRYLDLALDAARARAYPKEAVNEQAPPSSSVPRVAEQAAPSPRAVAEGRPPKGA